MDDWQLRLEIKDIYHNDDVPLHEKARLICERINALDLAKFDDDLSDERDEIALDFKDFHKDKSSDVEDFDSIMERLYDWADTQLDDGWPRKKLCWVATF